VSFDDACTLKFWAAQHVPKHLTFKKPEYSHCTVHVSQHPDHPFAETFYGDTCINDTLTADFLYFDSRHAAVAVQLTEDQLPLFDVPNSFPHITVAKIPNLQWKDLGPFVLRCHLTNDWQQTEDLLTWYSPAASAHRVKAPPLIIDCLRSVFAISLSTGYRLTSLTAPQTGDISPLLSSVPSGLWAKHKYDVGLIRDCAPVVITPKSSYRPHRKQYPLRRDALDGIQPVFDSLLKEKVIVPSADSPVLTPIFPVMKIRPEGQPTEWRFVQDLQAVNSAIIPPAPLVPNPHTILSLIPSSAKYFSVVDLANAFFSIPVHPDSQFWFAFMFKGHQYTWTR
uniref:Reverse transcriptase domain-containing protein n=2 Tax=Gouania willdenowi TaxID=441366 RepID=A0A8C5H2T9_GOUWI